MGHFLGVQGALFIFCIKIKYNLPQKRMSLIFKLKRFLVNLFENLHAGTFTMHEYIHKRKTIAAATARPCHMLPRRGSNEIVTCAQYYSFVHEEVEKKLQSYFFVYSLQQKQCTTALNEKSRVFLGQSF